MVGYTKFNKPRKPLYKNFEKRHRVLKQWRKKNKGVQVTPVADPELITGHILKKRKTNPRANITLSGKKRNKILKQLRRIETDKLRMEVESSTMTIRRKRKDQIKVKSKIGKQAVASDKDVEMKE